MKREDDNSNTLKSILQKWKAKYVYEEKLDQEKVRALWTKVSGETVNNYTRSIILKNRMLYITISSAVLRQELSFKYDSLLEELNNEFEQPIIDKMIIK